MSTRSNIGIENEDGSVTYVYCHYDGYPSGVGKDIVNMSRREARALINRGDMSCVGEHYHETRSEPWEDVCAQSATSIADYAQKADNDYAYVINRHGTWKFKSYRDNTWRSLKRELSSPRAGL